MPRMAKLRFLAAITTFALVFGACSSSATPSPAASVAAPSASSVATATPPASAEPSSPAASAGAQATCPNMPTQAITLTYWEASGLYLSDAGVAQLDKEFMATYPNVKLVRVAKSFADITSTERLQASGPQPPDILVSNAGYVLLGPLVKAGLVQPLDKYASTFGWETRFSPAVLNEFKFSTDGSTWGAGSLYAVSPAASFVGLYYNTTLLDQLSLQVPTTWEQFDASLAAAKKAGIVPIAAGIQDGWPAVQMYTTYQNAMTPTDQINGFEFHVANATFNTTENIKAAELAVQHVNNGYYSPGLQGKTAQAAIEDFNAGKALYYIQGTYFAGPIFKGLGDKAGMTLVPPMSGGSLSVTGGPGLGWAISSKSQNADAAACYIDWRTGQHAADLYVSEGGLPAMSYAYSGSSAFTKSVFNAWAQANAKNAIVPYIDFATPNLLTVLTSTIQELLGNKLTPAEFVQQVQQAYAQFKP
jgi:raffinose/stachyose/melibiose transport system substrate-binding protein